MSTRIGILSDTHLIRSDASFQRLVDHCFADIPVILHAGDLTDISVLAAFGDREVHAVHGNMCHLSSRSRLPEKKVITIDGYTIGLMHGMGFHHDVEDHLIRQFDQVDCIVSGHTHRPLCRSLYDVLFINPGSFMGFGRYGAAGTYAVLETGERLTARIFETPPIVT